MINETLTFENCDAVCGELEMLTKDEMSFEYFITGSVSAPAA